MSLRIQAKQPTVVNLLSSPENLTASPWTLPSVTALSNTELAPDGTYTASKFTYLSIFSGVDYDLDSIVTTGETYTLSVYAKATTENIAFTSYGSWHNYNVRYGYAPDGQNVITSSITPAANGFYRCAYTFTVPADHTYHNIRFWLGGFNGSDWTGNTMTLWGAQLIHTSNLETYYSQSQLNSGVRIQSRQQISTNLLSSPEDFSIAPWYTNNATIISNAAIAPDGTMTADKLVGDNGVTIRKAVYQRYAVTSGTTYTFSVYLKAAGYTTANIWHDSLSVGYVGAGTFIYLDTGTTSDPVTITDAGNGWYRCSVTATHPTANNPAFEISLGEANGSYPPGNGVDGIYLWGAQLDVGSTALPYRSVSQLNSGFRIRETAPLAGSLSFNGSTQKLTLPASEDWNLGLGDFTIEWFQYMTSPNGSVFDIIVSDQYWPVVLAVYFNENTIFVQQPNGSGSGSNLNSVIPEYINVWVHFAVVRHSGFIRLYANGELALSIPDTGINISGANSQLTVGGVSNNRLGLTNFPGKITNFRLVKDTAIYTTWPFTPPTAPLEAVANTKLLLLTEQKNPLKDSSGLDKQVTNVGNTPWDSSTPF